MLSSLQPMLENLAIRHNDSVLEEFGNVLQEAISQHLSSNGPKTYDIGGQGTTSEVGDAIASRVAHLLTADEKGSQR